MTTIFNSFKCGLTASLIALGAVALTGCSNELAEQQQAGAAGGAAGATEVEIVPSFVGQVSGLTRAADNLNTSTTGFSSTTETARIFVDGGSYDATFTEYAYTGNGTSLTAPTPAPTFPVQSTVTSVNVYGWYPALDTSKSFSIQGDQSSDAYYVKSDLMLANQVQCEREVDSSDKTAWRVKTAAALQFRHVMAKAKITFKSVDGTKITAVKLKNIYPTVAIDDATKTALAIGAASGSAGDVTLWTGEKTDNTDQVACGVFPPQSIAANTNFIEVVTDAGSVYYTVGAAAKAFEGGKEYAVTIEVGSSDVNHTVSLGNWTQSSTVANFYNVDYRTAQSTTKMTSNLLYYVAQYNNKSKTAFESDHANVDITSGTVTGKPVFNFTDASACSISGYHVPSVGEQVGIIPSNSVSANGPNLFSVVSSTDANSPYELQETGVYRNATAITTSIKSVMIRGNAANEIYAVRFINTDYASAWHYKWGGNGLIIESYVLNVKPTTLEEGKLVLGALPSSSVWASAANVAPGSDNTGKSYCFRYLPACGYKDGSSGSAATTVGKYCLYWSKSAMPSDGSKAFYWRVGSGDLLESTNAKTYGFSVRMFLN